MATAKRNVQSAVRRLHVMTARDLPARLSIYLHDLPQRRWDAFRSSVAYLKGLGYQFTDPTGLCAPGEDKRIMLSFDDSFQSWWTARNLFDELDVKATFYVNTFPTRDRADQVAVETYFRLIEQDANQVTPLASDEIRELAAAGHSIGAHGHTHRDLGSIPMQEARDDIVRSRDELEEILGQPVVHFSYPYGMRRNFNEELRDYCVSIGFETVANAIPGLQHVGHRQAAIQRTGWHLDEPIIHNIDNLRIDGRWFEKLTGRSAAPF